MHRNDVGRCAIHPTIVLVCEVKTRFYKRFQMGVPLREPLPSSYKHFKRWDGTRQDWGGLSRHELLYPVRYLDVIIMSSQSPRPRVRTYT